MLEYNLALHQRSTVRPLGHKKKGEGGGGAGGGGRGAPPLSGGGSGVGLLSFIPSSSLHAAGGGEGRAGPVVGGGERLDGSAVAAAATLQRAVCSMPLTVGIL